MATNNRNQTACLSIFPCSSLGGWGGGGGGGGVGENQDTHLFMPSSFIHSYFNLLHFSLLYAIVLPI